MKKYYSKVLTLTLLLLLLTLIYIVFTLNSPLDVHAMDVDQDNYNESKGEYLQPAFGDYEVIYGNSAADGIESAPEASDDSKKDMYENNNTYKDATQIYTNPSGKPSNYSKAIYATIHRDPWYYLFWRDLDEDYYRFDVLGDANIYITLSMPSNVDYDLELYNHLNKKDCTWNAEDIKEKGASRKSGNLPESINVAITPGTYYLRVYPYGANSYNADVNYVLTYSINYTGTDASVTNLKSQGAKAAIWKSDIDPFEIKPFNPFTDVKVGFLNVYGSTITDNYANPFHDNLKARANSGSIVQSVVYIMDLEWRRELCEKLTLLAYELEQKVQQNKQIQFNIKQAVDAGNTLIRFMSLLPGSTPLLIIDFAYTGATSLLPVLFPDIWDTNREALLNYVKTLRVALDSESSAQAVTIKCKYIYKSVYVSIPGSSGYIYYIDYTPVVAYNESFFHKQDIIPSYNLEGFTFGKIYSIKTTQELKDIIGRILPTV